MGRIPKATKSSCSPIPSMKPVFTSSAKGLTFSFEALDRTEYFNLDGTCQNWASDLFDMMKEASRHNEIELMSQRIRTYRVHTHETARCPSQLPQGVELKDCYQIRISASKGGIHGVFLDNTFYVIWLDPLHNMYPDDRFGGLRKVKAPSTCCKDRDNEIIKLREELDKAKEDAAEWEKFAQYLLDGRNANNHKNPAE